MVRISSSSHDMNVDDLLDQLQRSIDRLRINNDSEVVRHHTEAQIRAAALRREVARLVNAVEVSVQHDGRSDSDDDGSVVISPPPQRHSWPPNRGGSAKKQRPLTKLCGIHQNQYKIGSEKFAWYDGRDIDHSMCLARKANGQQCNYKQKGVYQR